MTDFFAHTKSDADGNPLPTNEWEPLFTPFDAQDNPCQRDTCHQCESWEPRHGHLNKVGYWTAKFAGEMFSPHSKESKSAHSWGYIAGLWHDLGKFAPEWQAYLRSQSDFHQADASEKVDHSTAGAIHAISKGPHGHFLACAIAGHHAGLLDARHESRSSMEKRLRKSTEGNLPSFTIPPAIGELPLPPIPRFIPDPRQNAFASAFFQRMLYSCLVDADFLATESFVNPNQARLRPLVASDLFPKALRLLEEEIRNFGQPDGTDPVATARATVYEDCSRSANSRPGLFTLTVPTGGGKTLSSLNFALRHAIAHHKRRIIYVVPYISIIEQNASVFRKILSPLGKEILIEHHSNLAPGQAESQTTTSRLAAENWDAPFIVTTAVQFYESLFASRTSRSRKLHNIANSVVILDEAQCLPVQYLTPCLRALEELVSRYSTSTVLCTATQPTVARSPDFPIGFTDSHEIISDPESLFRALKRVEITYRGTLNDPTIASEIAAAKQVLCIVNTRKHARNLFALLPPSEENFHLSTLMCPHHRLAVFSAVRKRLAEKQPVRLIATQLVEAGVDIDFPLVYRSMSGLDSIAQAAGRCNREGHLPGYGQTHVFHSEHPNSERHFAQTSNTGHEILDLHQKDPLSPQAVKAYFHKYYTLQKKRWDAKEILTDFQYTGSKELPFLFNYRSASDKFQFIENNQIPVLIPWTDEIKTVIDQQLRNESVPLHRQLLRNLQPYTIQIYESEFRKNHHQFESLRDGQFHILICPETHYSENVGLHFSDEFTDPGSLICS